MLGKLSCSKQFTMNFILACIFLLLRYSVSDYTGENYDELDSFPVTENVQSNSMNSNVDLLQYEDKIAGGFYAADKQFPFMAVVHRLLPNGVVSQCGGTIISRRWVLTAGHCVGTSPRRFLVVFGIINKSQIAYDHNYGPGVAMITSNALTHPGYHDSTNDIGLLYMPRNIPYSEKIQPIRLAGYNEAEDSFADLNAYVVGWGKDGQMSSATKALKYALLPIITDEECRTFWQIDDRNICTASDLGQNACQGDSGGPLLIMRNKKPLQVGIVSYGDGNCPSGKPAVFTRVTTFLPWIKRVTGLRF